MKEQRENNSTPLETKTEEGHKDEIMKVSWPPIRKLKNWFGVSIETEESKEAIRQWRENMARIRKESNRKE
jgi:hypothetical protein